MALAGTSSRAAPACHSTCTEQLAACKRTCPVAAGQARRDCRAACTERSTCTAPGARIRMLAYVVSECTTDPEGLSSFRQKLLIRRGNCDPVTVMEAATATPVRDPTTACRSWGESRYGEGSMRAGIFQHMGALPDASGVIFEVTKQFSLYPPVTPEPPRGEGIFFVRADGSGLRRLGPAGRFPPILPDGLLTGTVFSISPDGRSIALIDLGPDTEGREAPQIFVMDLRSGRRTQLTHLPNLARAGDPGMRAALFANKRTITFYTGSQALGTMFEVYRVKTNGSGVPEQVRAPTLVPGAHVVAQFAVGGSHPEVVLVSLPEEPVNPVAGSFVLELFLVDGNNLVQLTNFGRADTHISAVQNPVARDRALFVASADPLGENPNEICQLFSVNERGGGLRQLTHLPSDGRPPHGCDRGDVRSTCAIDVLNDLMRDKATGTVLLMSGCDPVGRNPLGDQIFAVGSDGSGSRQLTATRGMTTDADGTVDVEMPGPFAYPLGRP